MAPILDNLTGSTNIIFKGDHQRGIWTKFCFIPSSGSEEHFQRFQIFQQMAAILCIGQSDRPQFWKRTIQEVSHQSLVQFDPMVLKKKIKM